MNNQLYDYITRLKEEANKDTPKGHFIRVLYDTIQSPFTKSILPIVFSSAIAVECALFAWSWLVITSVFFAISAIIFCIADLYREETYRESKCLNEVTHQYNILNSGIAESTRNVIKKMETGAPINHDTFSRISYNDVCSYVCTSVYRVILVSLGKNSSDAGLNVTIYVKSRDQGGERIDLAGFANHDNDCPPGRDDPCYLNDENGKNYYHKALFKKRLSKNDIIILENKKKIIANLPLYSTNETREKQIEQYIGIPVCCTKDGTVALLQLDTTEKDLLGRDMKGCKDLGKSLKPFVNLLLVYYYTEYLFDIIFSEFSERQAV